MNLTKFGKPAAKLCKIFGPQHLSYQGSPLTLNKFRQSKLVDYSWFQYARQFDSSSILKLKLLLDKRSRYRKGKQRGRDHHST